MRLTLQHMGLLKFLLLIQKENLTPREGCSLLSMYTTPLQRLFPVMVCFGKSMASKCITIVFFQTFLLSFYLKQRSRLMKGINTIKRIVDIWWSVFWVWKQPSRQVCIYRLHCSEQNQNTVSHLCCHGSQHRWISCTASLLLLPDLICSQEIDLTEVIIMMFQGQFQPIRGEYAVVLFG